MATASPTRKRPAPDDDISNLSTPNKMAKSSPMPTISTPTTSPKATSLRAASPSPSILTSIATMSPPPGLSSGTTSLLPTKKIKRTKEEIENEKKAKEAQKEEKRIAMEEKKRKREEEEQLRNEEKRKKAEEREEKKREKDLKIQVKEQEKQRKIDEQEKKEKAQSRLLTFFSLKQGNVPLRTQDVNPSEAIPAESASPSKNTRSEYEAFFLPFHLTSHTRLPKDYFDKFQQIEEDYDWNIDSALDSLPRLPISRKPRRHQFPVKEIIDLLQGSSSQNPIDLTSDCSKQKYALQLLNETPMKYLHFWEDVRPPYYGTWTKSLTAQQWRHLARNPFYQLDLFDYDYDSEAEWEEPEEGEDLNSDDEEEEDDGEDDMAEFLDDEETAGDAPRRKLFKTDLIPNCSGLQWEDDKGNLQPAGGAEEADFSDLAVEFLLNAPILSIDPYSTVYWAKPEPVTKIKSSAGQQAGLLTVNRPALVDKTKQMNGIVTAATQPLKAARMVASEDLESFKMAIDGQDLTKIAMIEHLKKMFPKLHKDAIVNTLSAVAERESKKPNAKWRLKSA